MTDMTDNGSGTTLTKMEDIEAGYEEDRNDETKRVLVYKEMESDQYSYLFLRNRLIWLCVSVIVAIMIIIIIMWTTDKYN